MAKKRITLDEIRLQSFVTTRTNTLYTQGGATMDGQCNDQKATMGEICDPSPTKRATTNCELNGTVTQAIETMGNVYGEQNPTVTIPNTSANLCGNNISQACVGVGDNFDPNNHPPWDPTTKPFGGEMTDGAFCGATKITYTQFVTRFMYCGTGGFWCGATLTAQCDPITTYGWWITILIPIQTGGSDDFQCIHTRIMNCTATAFPICPATGNGQCDTAILHNCSGLQLCDDSRQFHGCDPGASAIPVFCLETNIDVCDITY